MLDICLTTQVNKKKRNIYYLDELPNITRKMAI